MSNELVLSLSPNPRPAALFTPTPKAAQRVLEFFTAQINNDHTRRAYINATRRFVAWCSQKNIDQLSHVQPFHVAAFVKDLQAELSPPSVKQHLAALRMLFDWPASWKWRSRSPTMNRPGRRSFTTGDRMIFLSTRSSGLLSETCILGSLVKP
jgi:site-specific recombinase XerD